MYFRSPVAAATRRDAISAPHDLGSGSLQTGYGRGAGYLQDCKPRPILLSAGTHLKVAPGSGPKVVVPSIINHIRVGIVRVLDRISEVACWGWG